MAPLQEVYTCVHVRRLMISLTVVLGTFRRREISAIDRPQILCMDRMKQTSISSRLVRPLPEPGRANGLRLVGSFTTLTLAGDEGQCSEGQTQGDQVDTGWDAVANDRSDGEADEGEDPKDEIKSVHAPWIPAYGPPSNLAVACPYQ